MIVPLWYWLFFASITLLLLFADLRISTLKSREASIKTNIALSVMYVIFSLLFSVFIYYKIDQISATHFLYAYLLEKSLSIDNVIIISCVFSYFKIPTIHQHRVLFYGILGVIVLRAIAIGAGISLLNHFHWLMYAIAFLLIFMGLKMFLDRNKEKDYSTNIALKFMQKHCRITDTLHGNSFVIHRTENGVIKTWITPLFVALIVIEFIDIIFAMDSLPAVFSITTDPFIVYTSNIFALLGLRSLYFVLSSFSNRFQWVNPVIALILIFIGFKSLIKLIGA